ncbi:ABC transporter permease [Helicobacter sp. MIT 00-7814]|uniref:FecCD family ABC transporter permease n=1 Tax=unclassified Helicobacter TaxID=2593540 RepID=UPI000E1F1F5B|nr:MULTISPECIES: iron ABC transporter permease [unclassified Helicobacter]RDU57109.1 ABC transporter permease [Helicobacter sp. MIT 00-7814]RDU57660.1 ABC transporter permease [Helicobacter sp. MIT 99-10781]
MKILSIFGVFVVLVIMAVSALSFGGLDIEFKRAVWLLFENCQNTQFVTECYIIQESRFPRIVAAIVIGGALALSGALYQGIIGNPLVSPGILGVLNGASFGAALAMILGFGILGIEIMCFIFGILAMGVALLLCFLFDGYKSVLMLILGGMISSSFFGAGVSVLKILADPYNTLPNIVFWLMGSLAYVQGMPLLVVSVVFVVSFIGSILLSRQIDIINLDDESANTLGIDVRKMRLIFVLIATLLASSSVALGGLIGWVGLVIPHIARFCIGANHRYMLPFCVIFGALFLLLCDTLSRSFASTEIPIGILTSIFGIPIFALVLFINKKRVK